MDSRFREAIRRRPALHSPLRQARRGLDAVGLRLAERLAEARSGHEILVVSGMRRSGNHLAIGWILAQVRVPPPSTTTSIPTGRPGPDG